MIDKVKYGMVFVIRELCIHHVSQRLESVHVDLNICTTWATKVVTRVASAENLPDRHDGYCNKDESYVILFQKVIVPYYKVVTSDA